MDETHFSLLERNYHDYESPGLRCGNGCLRICNCAVFQQEPEEVYTRAVWQLAQHYHRSPDQLSDEDLRQYFLYLANEKKLARPTTTVALCGIKFFYEQTLQQPWPTLGLVRPPREHKLPVVLSRKSRVSFSPGL